MELKGHIFCSIKNIFVVLCLAIILKMIVSVTISELSEIDSIETESLHNQTSHLSAQIKNINSKAKRRTQKPARNPKRKKKWFLCLKVVKI